MYIKIVLLRYTIYVFDNFIGISVKTQYDPKEMSSYLEVTPKMLSKYESGDYDFSLSQICDICEKLNLKLSLSIIEN